MYLNVKCFSPRLAAFKALYSDGVGDFSASLLARQTNVLVHIGLCLTFGFLLDFDLPPSPLRFLLVLVADEVEGLKPNKRQCS